MQMKFLASFVQIMMLLLLSIVVMVWQQMITISPAVLLQWQSANQTVTVCEIADINSSTQEICLLDILFSSNHNIHKSSFGLCFWASDPLIERF